MVRRVHVPGCKTIFLCRGAGSKGFRMMSSGSQIAAAPSDFTEYRDRRDACERRINGLYARFGKRTFDVAFALFLLPVLVPAIAILWSLTRLDGHAGFYGHTRIGRNGKLFRCWKIRTMVPDADARLRRILETDPGAAAEWARTQKLALDPRVTTLGAFLRRTSLDELPQIWNVLRGDMSIVGPRPVTRAEMRRYGPHRVSYLTLKPGITGIWQTSGRSELSYADRVRMDASYLGAMSLRTDLTLVARTLEVVRRRSNC
jgi:lipopolysaccharide/colanic/teichoic acid biosynthesis glycosyltransferase